MELSTFLQIERLNRKAKDPKVNTIFAAMQNAIGSGQMAQLDQMAAQFRQAHKQYQAKQKEVNVLLAQARKAPVQVGEYDISYSADIRTYHIVSSKGVMKGFKAQGARDFLCNVG